MKEYFYWSGLILNTAIAIFIAGVIVFIILRMLFKLYKKTWVYDGWQTFKGYRSFVIKKQPLNNNIPFLVHFRKSKRITKMPMVFKRFWFGLIDNKIKQIEDECQNVSPINELLCGKGQNIA